MVSLFLPDVKLEVPGKLLKVHEEDDSTKCVFELDPDSRSERQISQFILRQQSIILRELKDICTIGAHG